jgi:hypothetical protein
MSEKTSNITHIYDAIILSFYLLFYMGVKLGLSY